MLGPKGSSNLSALIRKLLNHFMLKSVSISNLAVISHLRVDFHFGLNLLTGETGAGKSIVVDALGLLIGSRAWSDLVRTGEDAAAVEGIFAFDDETERLIRANLAEIGVVLNSEDYLTVRREVQVNGRNRVYINDKNVTLGTLRSLQPFLIEIHGQGEQRSLFDPRAQLQLLDNFAECDSLREQVGRLYLRRRDVLRRIQASQRDVSERERLIDLLRYQIDELGRLETFQGEKGELEKERHLLLHAEKVAELSGRAFGELYEDDKSALTILKSVQKRVRDLVAIDGRLHETLSNIENAELLIKDVAEELRHYNNGVTFDPRRLDQIESRLSELERFERKYGCPADELIGMGQRLKVRLDEMINWSEHGAALREDLARVSGEYASLAKRLSDCRRKSLAPFEKKVIDNLGSLAMEQAQFKIVMDTASEEAGEPDAAALTLDADEGADFAAFKEGFWTPFGADRLEFWLSANPGENLRPLSRVASGGELSRLMLILRTVCHRVEDGKTEATLVFDEIDTGIGGRVAETVGQRLKTLAAGKQVFCVTHQPQIARFADHHFAVSKGVSGGRTETTIKELTFDERVGELARMIGGSEDVETAKVTAQWLISSAQAAPTPPKKSSRSRRVSQSK
jgi:DNA repair protein RecN (Recombination protein N)